MVEGLNFSLGPLTFERVGRVGFVLVEVTCAGYFKVHLFMVTRCESFWLACEV